MIEGERPREGEVIAGRTAAGEMIGGERPREKWLTGGERPREK